MSEQAGFNSPNPPIVERVYTRRWYILFLFSFSSFLQSAFWITFSSVVNESTAFFGVGQSTIAFLLALGAIFYLPATPPVVWGFSQLRNGLSNLTVIGVGMVAFGGVLRCASFLNPRANWSLWVVGFAQTLVALVGPIVMSAPPKLSARWFPIHERTLATAISSCANNLGSGIGFLVPPYLVENFGFRYFLLTEAGVGAFFFMLILLYFPESPPHPPSATAAMDEKSTESFTKEMMFKAVRDIFTNPSFLALSLVGGWQAGLLNAWQGLFDDIFNPYFSEEFVGWLGFFFIAASAVGGVIGGFLCDKFFQQKFKMLLIILFSAQGVVLIIFSLAFPSAISDQPILHIHPYVSASLLVICGILYGFCTPIFLEFGVELTFPLSPIMSSGWFTFWINLISLIFLVAPIPNNLLNCITAFSITACIIPLIFIKETYARSDVDNNAIYDPTN